jgi:hypothetical protein
MKSALTDRKPQANRLRFFVFCPGCTIAFSLAVHHPIKIMQPSNQLQAQLNAYTGDSRCCHCIDSFWSLPQLNRPVLCTLLWG